MASNTASHPPPLDQLDGSCKQYISQLQVSNAIKKMHRKIKHIFLGSNPGAFSIKRRELEYFCIFNSGKIKFLNVNFKFYIYLKLIVYWSPWKGQNTTKGLRTEQGWERGGGAQMWLRFFISALPFQTELPYPLPFPYFPALRTKFVSPLCTKKVVYWGRPNAQRDFIFHQIRAKIFLKSNVNFKLFETL